MVIILVRTVILYLVVLFTLQIMGKSELSKMSPFQLVIIFLIAELAGIPISNSSASLINGVVAIFTLMFLQVLLSFLSIKSEKIKNFISGKPSILIEKGEINEKELRKQRVTLNDLLEQLRLGNSPSIADVEYAVMEANGELSIIPKADKRPLTPSDMSIDKEPEAMPLMIITDGTICKKNLNTLGWEESLLEKQLKALNLESPKDVFLAYTDEQSRLRVYVSVDGGCKAKEVSVCATS